MHLPSHSRPRGGARLRALLLPLLACAASGTALAQSCAGLSLTTPGQSSTCTVPAGVTKLAYEVVGGNGGRGGLYEGDAALISAGGMGALVKGELSVTPNQTLYLSVGSHGQDGLSTLPTGGGGGGVGGAGVGGGR